MRKQRRDGRLPSGYETIKAVDAAHRKVMIWKKPVPTTHVLDPWLNRRKSKITLPQIKFQQKESKE